MSSLGDCVKEYAIQLSKGQIQTAYRGIMTFMSDLRSHLEHKYSSFAASALYFGHMDMTYFAFTPSSLRDRRLKTAIVYLHKECRFRHVKINGQISLSLGFFDRNCKCQLGTDANTGEKETAHPAHV